MNHEREMLRDLARRYAEVAFSAETKEKAANWGRLNALDASSRPPVILDQLPWNEFAREEELQCLCSDPLLRKAEQYFRSQLFRHRHFGADLVLAPFYPCGKVFTDSGYGMEEQRQNEEGHEQAQTHLFVDQLPDMAAIAKLKNHVVTAHPEETQRNKTRLEESFGDILEVRPMGVMLWEGVWDRITFLKGAESILYALMDEPELLHAIMKRCMEIEMDYVDQLEAQQLLAAGPGAVCHCVETYTDEEKWRRIDQNHIRTGDCWISGAAQIFSEVSPAMHEEFEIDYLKPLYDRFGWVNYGCCDPLDRKIDMIRKLKTVRSISASPWTNVEMQAEAMGKDYVMLRKSNPAFVVAGHPDEAAVRKEVRTTLNACRRNGTPVAFVLKDITSCGGRVECLTEWTKIVQDEISR